MSLTIALEITVDTGGEEPFVADLWQRNITTNLAAMWTRAGMAGAFRDADKRLAGALLPQLEAGVAAMLNDPLAFEKLNPPDGWGNYEGALKFAQSYRDACRRHPKATVRIIG